MTSLIRSAALQGYPELVTRLQGDASNFLRSAHIDPKKIYELDGVISLQAHMRLLENSARQLQCDDFGLRLAQYQDLMVLGPLAVVALGEKTVRAALEKIAELMHFHSPGLNMQVRAKSPSGNARLEFHLGIYAPENRQFFESALGVAQNAMRMLCQNRYQTTRVLLGFPSPLPQQCYQRYFHAPVIVDSGCNALEFSAAYLAQPLVQNNDVMYATMEQFVRESVGDRQMELVEQVKLLIMSLLPTGRCSLKIVALQLGINPRTLQRRLADQSLIFEQLVDQLRRRSAGHYLAEINMPLMQVAGLLGYAEQSSFNRACRRWFNSTPLEYRAQLDSAARSIVKRH